MKKSLVAIITICFFSPTQAQTLHVIEAGNFFYRPDSLTITVGDTVRWVNVGGFHNVNADVNTLNGESYNNPESFVSDASSNAELLTREFTVAGTYNYDCSVGSHAANGMVAKLVVVDDATSTRDLTDRVGDLGVIHQVGSANLQIRFNLKGVAARALIKMTNLTGQQLLNENISATAGQNEHSIRFPVGATSGIYFISLYVDGGVKTVKTFIP